MILLRLHDDPDVPLDFRHAYWGHAMHAGTWRSIAASNRHERAQDRRELGARYTVMVHSDRPPHIGQRVKYSTAGPDGGTTTMEATIFDWENCGNPEDMWTLYIRVTDADRIAAGFPPTSMSEAQKRERWGPETPAPWWFAAALFVLLFLLFVCMAALGYPPAFR